MASTQLPALPLPVLMIVALTSLSLSTAARAQAPCAQWNPASLHQIVQGQGLVVYTNLRRQGGRVEGTAAYTVIRNQGGERVGSGVDGGVSGTLDGNRFKVDIRWSDGTTGAYEGQVAPDGRIEGVTFNRANPSTRAPWRGAMVCGDLPPAAKPALSSPMSKPLRLGKREVPAAPFATCVPGFVWRTARSDDLVCVTPESRDLVAEENRSAPQRWNPGGAYGAATCITGFVWREAFVGDTVCVTPKRRADVQQENQFGPAHRAAR